MSWLQKLKDVAKAGSTIIPIYGPLIAALIPGTRDDAIIARTSDTLTGLTSIIASVQVSAEALKGAGIDVTGAHKLAMATPAAVQAILQSAVMAGKKVKDPVKFQAACAGITSNLADLMDSVE